jgi:hypothetical protein
MFILTPTNNGARSVLLPKKVPGERSLIMPNWVTGVSNTRVTRAEGEFLLVGYFCQLVLKRQSEVILLSH